uniref:Papain family cysteine protease n=1 Tax=Trepomonas sp. PC1 TaxID=1076344 RepID=A0A146K8Q3_9EUKA|eukprot:JAP91849.1 Papain family cysteine protease [Trepomonas sp. PC1]
MLTLQYELSDAKCEKEFKKFMFKYQKQYPTIEKRNEARYFFCQKFSFIQNNDMSFKMKINRFSDQEKPPTSLKTEPLSQNYEGKVIIPSKAYDADVATYNRDPADMTAMEPCADLKNQVFYYTNSGDLSFLNLTNGPPARADLRKLGTVPAAMDQGSCGSCYVFAATLQFSSLLLRDLPYYLAQDNLKTQWNVTSQSTKLSVQYILNRTFGSNQYCAGGNYQAVAADLSNTRIDTLEFAANFPYTAMFSSDSETYSAPDEPVSELNSTEKLNPVHHFGYQAFSNCPLSNIRLQLSNPDHVTYLKSVLARGIAVAGAMHTEGGEESENTAFMSYASGIFKTASPCSVGSTNHQITFVGYGTYQGEEVWVFQNSWGVSWGIQGTFMVLQGENTMCTERTVEFVLPRYWGYETDYDLPFNETQLFQDNFGKTKNLFDIHENSILDGKNGLDFADGTYIATSTNIGLLAIFVVGGLTGLIFLYYIMIWICCPPQNLLKPPIYIVFGQQDGLIFDWSKAKVDTKAEIQRVMYQ